MVPSSLGGATAAARPVDAGDATAVELQHQQAECAAAQRTGCTFATAAVSAAAPRQHCQQQEKLDPLVPGDTAERRCDNVGTLEVRCTAWGGHMDNGLKQQPLGISVRYSHLHVACMCASTLQYQSMAAECDA
eukprot:364062-Chlamydomonas_euryale.AAC.14